MKANSVTAKFSSPNRQGENNSVTKSVPKEEKKIEELLRRLEKDYVEEDLEIDPADSPERDSVRKSQPRSGLPPKVVPRPTQKKALEDFLEIYKKNYAALNFSQTGVGKTFMTAYLAQELKLKLMVVGPASTAFIWQDVIDTYALPSAGVFSYRALSSITGHQPKHGYLRREDLVDKKGEAGTIFSATEEFKALAREGVLLALDESQNLKNATAQRDACVALSQALMFEGSPSRVVLLSATPVDSEENAVSYMRLIGFISEPRLFEARGKKFLPTGLAQAIQLCVKMDPQKTYEIVMRHGISSKTAAAIVFELFTEVVEAGIMRAAEPPVTLTVKKDVGNGFYRLASRRDEKELNEAIKRLSSIVGYKQVNEAGGQAKISAGTFGLITNELVAIERLMTPVLARLARTDLEEIPRCKVILVVNYSQVESNSVDLLREMLADYRPLVLRGDVRPRDREEVVRAFQEDPRRRLLIMTARTGGVGLNLHDRVGNAPRRMYISPSYNLMDIEQATGRIYRDGSKSDAFIRIVYSKTETELVNIIQALARKTRVLRRALEGTSADQMTYPGEYPRYVEK